MSFRISPLWWPVLALASPVIVPWLVVRNRSFKKNRARVAELNHKRISQAQPLDLPALDFLELTVLVEWKTKAGFVGDAGVSYLFRSNLGSLLFDVGFGPTRPALAHNAAKLGFDLNQADALAISHLHLDHMGGLPAQRARRVTVPDELLASGSKPCFVPDRAEAQGFEAQLVQEPQLLCAGIASSGPLARSMFVFEHSEEQALLARVGGKGLVVFTGCGHPTIEVILDMVRRLSDEPLYAIGGGLHFPVSDGRGNRAGVRVQTILASGKPPWQRITDADLGRTISAINKAGPQRVCLSAHDTCDQALARFKRELEAETEVLAAGGIYHF